MTQVGFGLGELSSQAANALGKISKTLGQGLKYSKQIAIAGAAIGIASDLFNQFLEDTNKTN